MSTDLTVTRLRPMPGYILVRPADVEKQTSSGIYLPSSPEEKPQYGTVLAVGADWITEQGTTIKSPVTKNDVVIYKKWGGNEVKIENKEYQFLKFEDVLAVVSGK